MITLNAAPANNLDNPNTEKNPALPAISNAEIPKYMWKFLERSIIFSYLQDELDRMNGLIPEDISPANDLLIKIIRGLKQKVERIENIVELEEDGIQ